MNDLVITAASRVTQADVASARLGNRFGRLDLASQLALLAVETLGVKFDAWAADRVGLCLAARAGSLSTDVEYWNGREGVGGPSPTLFAYTLPSAALGEIAIRHRLTGPNLCLVGGGEGVLAEAGDMLRRNEADACVCVTVNAISSAAAALTGLSAEARAIALLLQWGGEGLRVLRENDRDMDALCALVCGRQIAS